MTKHPAHAMPFYELHGGLMDAVARGLVFEKKDDYGLSLFCYTKECAYAKAWDKYTRLARGLILDTRERRIVATPFEKFFNYGEAAGSLPAEPFDVYEKMDGSLVILYFHPRMDCWVTATKGSFGSDQAVWARKYVDDATLRLFLPRGNTYLLEACGRENRIVVNYDWSGLVLLAGYTGEGVELDRDHLAAVHVMTSPDWRLVKKVTTLHKLEHILEATSGMPSSEEGYVVRFKGGLRIKFKGEEYCRVHRLISNVTPLGVWGILAKGDDLEPVRKQLPEEFLKDFDQIEFILMARFGELILELTKAHDATKHMTDKELGLVIDGMESPVVRAQLFAYRKSAARGQPLPAMTKEWLWRYIRPTGNKLAGYRPTSTMNRFHESEE